MSGVNKVILIGTLGQDPEVRYTQGGKCVANLNIATSEKYNDNESTEWHKVVLFGKQAESAQQYLSKGKKVYVEGKINTQKWQDNNGNDRYTTQIIAHNTQFLSPNQGNTNPRQQQPHDSPSQGGNGGCQQPAPSQNQQRPSQQPQTNFDDLDDSIPF